MDGILVYRAFARSGNQAPAIGARAETLLLLLQVKHLSFAYLPCSCECPSVKLSLALSYAGPSDTFQSIVRCPSEPASPVSRSSQGANFATLSGISRLSHSTGCPMTAAIDVRTVMRQSTKEVACLEYTLRERP